MVEEEQSEGPGYAFPLPRKQESDKTIRWKIDPEDVIKEIIHYLRGDYFDDEDLTWKPQGFIYYFKVQAPVWIHQNIVNLEAEGHLRFDTSFYSDKTLTGSYSISEITSFNLLISFFDQSKKQLKKEKSKETITYSIKKSEPQRMVNEIGLRVISTRLRSYLNKNVILSNFDNEMIKRMALENSIDIIKLLYMSYDKFAIEKSNLTNVLRIIDINVYASLLRAKEGFFVDHLSTTQRYIEQSNINTENKSKDKKKILPNLFGNWKGED